MIDTNMDSPSRTPTTSPPKKTIRMTQVQKQALIDNLQLESKSIILPTLQKHPSEYLNNSNIQQSPNARANSELNTPNKPQASDRVSRSASTASRHLCEKRTWASSSPNTTRCSKTRKALLPLPSWHPPRRSKTKQPQTPHQAVPFRRVA